MEFSWWLVLLAGFAGWCIGYEKLRHSLSNLPRILTRSSGSDLSTLLPDHNDQVERDLELNNLLEQYAVDDNSVELYLTLGDAFRRRGEYSRAIAVHEHLLSKGHLSDDQQRKVKLEMARDYAGAGLLDRVEALLKPLVKDNPEDAASQASLLRLYEKQQEWEAAIELASVSTSMAAGERAALKAQYYCELAVVAELEDDLPAMEKWLQRALKSEPHCSRALVMLGGYCIELKQYRKAISNFEKIEEHHPELVPEIAQSYFFALHEVDDNEEMLRKHLEYVRGRQNSYSVIKLARDAIGKLEGEKKASQFFIEQLAKRPSLKGLRDWAEYEMQLIKTEDREKVAAVVDMLRDVTDEKPVYLCNRCGYRCKQIQWLCPGCENWNSVKVIIGAEGE